MANAFTPREGCAVPEIEAVAQDLTIFCTIQDPPPATIPSTSFPVFDLPSLDCAPINLPQKARLLAHNGNDVSIGFKTALVNNDKCNQKIDLDFDIPCLCTELKFKEFTGAETRDNPELKRCTNSEDAALTFTSTKKPDTTNPDGTQSCNCEQELDFQLKLPEFMFSCATFEAATVTVNADATEPNIALSFEETTDDTGACKFKPSITLSLPPIGATALGCDDVIYNSTATALVEGDIVQLSGTQTDGAGVAGVPAVDNAPSATIRFVCGTIEPGQNGLASRVSKQLSLATGTATSGMNVGTVAGSKTTMQPGDGFRVGRTTSTGEVIVVPTDLLNTTGSPVDRSFGTEPVDPAEWFECPVLNTTVKWSRYLAATPTGFTRQYVTDVVYKADGSKILYIYRDTEWLDGDGRSIAVFKEDRAEITTPEACVPAAT